MSCMLGCSLSELVLGLSSVFLVTLSGCAFGKVVCLIAFGLVGGANRLGGARSLPLDRVATARCSSKVSRDAGGSKGASAARWSSTVSLGADEPVTLPTPEPEIEACCALLSGSAALSLPCLYSQV
jgi:hypothetical protein